MTSSLIFIVLHNLFLYFILSYFFGNTLADDVKPGQKYLADAAGSVPMLSPSNSSCRPAPPHLAGNRAELNSLYVGWIYSLRERQPSLEFSATKPQMQTQIFLPLFEQSETGKITPCFCFLLKKRYNI